MSTPTAVVTMAGMSRRFREAGFHRPKFELEVRGRTLMAWSLDSLAGLARQGAPFVFVTQRSFQAGAFIRKEAALQGIEECRVVELDGPTDGQATTALAAQPVVAQSSPIAVYNIDTYVEQEAIPWDQVRGDGWIPCFGAPGDHWSFVKVDEEGRATEVAEKRRISPHATIGLYYFSSMRLFAEAATRPQPGPERYVAPLYNVLIQQGRPVYIHRISAAAVHPLGTPEEVASFARLG